MRDATWFDSEEEQGKDKKECGFTAIAYAENGNASWHPGCEDQIRFVDVRAWSIHGMSEVSWSWWRWLWWC